MVELLGPEGVNFFGRRGVNAADPLHDKDVVNLRSLRFFLDTFSGNNVGDKFRILTVGNGFPVYAGFSGGTYFFRSFSAGTNLGISTGNVITYFLQPNIKVSGFTASTVQVSTLSGNCNNIVTLDCFGNLTTSANTTTLYANLSAGTAIEIISGSNRITIRHTLWETGRTNAGGYSTEFMPVQLQRGGNITDADWALVAGSGNTNFSIFGNILGGTKNFLSASSYSFIGNGKYNSGFTSQYSFIGNGALNYISNNSRFSSILNGTGNSIYGYYSVIAGGYSNLSSGFTSFIGAGINNYTNGNSSIVVGGNSNYSYSNFASIIGGSGNRSYGGFSFIGNGFSNSGLSAYTTVINGSNNLSNERFSIITNGYNNISIKPYSFIGNGLYGNNNTRFGSILNGAYNSLSANSDYGTIINGTGNTIDNGLFNSIKEMFSSGKNKTAETVQYGKEIIYDI
jgi:hypothetical protein